MVEWTGPDYQNDYITIGQNDDVSAVTYLFTRHGSPVRIDLPDSPGDYDIWHTISEGDTILTRKSLRLD